MTLGSYEFTRKSCIRVFWFIFRTVGVSGLFKWLFVIIVERMRVMFWPFLYREEVCKGVEVITLLSETLGT